MEQTFLTSLKINHVRHLSDIVIPLSETQRKNLILTGKNGSGKTSTLNYFASHLKYIVSSSFSPEQKIRDSIAHWKKKIDEYSKNEENIKNKEQAQSYLSMNESNLAYWTAGCSGAYTSVYKLREKYQSGQFVLAFYSDDRKLTVSDYKHIEKVTLKPVYELQEHPSKELGKYLVDLKSTRSFARDKNDAERVQQIDAWFDRFSSVLRRIYQDDSLELNFDIDTFQFSICIPGREPFHFNEMSAGYAAVFDIVGDLMMRMETQKRYDLEGIVLIDEIETHLHVELQKDIVPILTTLFPNIQFVLTTHSPFVLNSTENAVVYDLEKHLLVSDGMTDLPYDGIVEGYFGADLLSQELRSQLDTYKGLVQKPNLTDSDYAAIAELEYDLDEVPDYLASEFAEEYNRLKFEFHSRG